MSKAFDAAVEQHFEVTLEAAALVVHVGENGKIRSLVQRVLDAAQHQRAIGIGHIENHDADGVAALAAQRSCELIGAVAKFFGGALDALFSDGGDIARQWRVIQNDRHRGGGETALLRYITNGDHGSDAPWKSRSAALAASTAFPPA